MSLAAVALPGVAGSTLGIMDDARENADGPAGQPVTRRRGRRRDVGVDRRILDVARAVYAERGWAGFNFDVVAHQARVSKDAVYRRYASKIDLLMATMARPADDHVPPMPDGDIRGFLIAVANRYFADYVSGYGLNSLRIYVEAPQNPELLEAYHRERSAPVITQTRAAIRAAMEAGALPRATSPTAVLDAIVGGVVMHVLATPPDLTEKMLAGAPGYLVDLVDLVLGGCGYDFGDE
jgi:AcrR family transcriptional regulator